MTMVGRAVVLATVCAGAPTASFHLHRKMLWLEFDFRTWAALDNWEDGVVFTKGVNASCRERMPSACRSGRRPSTSRRGRARRPTGSSCR